MNIIKRFWNYLFPARCLMCREKLTDGHSICKSCDAKLAK